METIAHTQKASSRSAAWKFAATSAVVLSGLLPTAAANAVPMVQPPPFVNEVNYLEFTINHHFSALRMTELAAGTSVVGSTSNFAGAPDVFAPTPAKATNDVALSVAIDANSAQRMEIVEAQGFLQTYYGINFTPSLQPIYQPLIATLDQAAAGDPFNIAFLETFSGHHATLLPPSQECTTAAPNADVRAYCANIVDSQTRQIAEMRAELANEYGITNIPYEIIPVSGGGTVVPEPATAALLAAGLLGLGAARRRQKAAGSAEKPAPTAVPYAA